MKILLHSLNYSPELTGIGKYNGELCPALVEQGHNINVITANPYYPEWKIHTQYSNRFNTESISGVTVHRCPVYVPHKMSLLKRIVHLTSFSITSFFKLLGMLKHRYDVVILVQPTLFCAPFVLLYCKLTGARSLMHIQDYEINAMLGLSISEKSIIAKVAKWFEKQLMKRFDKVSTISLSMMRIAVDKGVDKDDIIFFPNWADTDFVTPDTCGNKLKSEWRFTPDDKIILYAGNVSLKQGLEIIIEAAKALKDRTELKFVIVGTGAFIDTLTKLAEESNLKNVFFKPLQPWERVPEMLSLADLHLVIQKKGVADAVLPSKLTNILSCGGHAIVTAEHDTELGKIADANPGIYELVEPESNQALIDAIQTHFNSNTNNYNIVARDYAIQFLNFDRIVSSFLNDLEGSTSDNIRACTT
jgi:colanic acid biosynthesis glycosyl transferase WcaI